jgi:hypothetical protein
LFSVRGAYHSNARGYRKNRKKSRKHGASSTQRAANPELDSTFHLSVNNLACTKHAKWQSIQAEIDALPVDNFIQEE